MAIKTIRVFAEYTSDGYVPMPSQGNIDYGITIGNSFPETQPSSYQTDDPNIDVAVNTMTDFYVWIRTHGSPWNPSYTRVVRVYPDSPSINSVVMNMIVAVGSGGTSINAGGGVTYYLNGGTSQGVLDGSTYYEMSKTPVEGAMVDFFKIHTTGYENIAQFVTDAGDPSLLKIPPGAWPLGFYFSASDNSGNPRFYAEIYKYSQAGVFTLLGSSVASPEVISNGVAIDYYTTTVTIPDTTLLITDRIAIRIFVDTDGNRTVNFHTQDSHLATVGTTFANGLTAINGLTKQVQFITIGNAGSDAAIVSSDDTHTINLPTASATKRGLLNNTDWSTFNSKQAALSGTGFVKIDGSTISYDNSSYQPLDGDLTAIGALAGTSGILKKTGSNTWELDTTTYLSTGVAADTYQRKDKMVSNLLASDTEYPNSNAVLAKLALKADIANPQFTGSMNIKGAESRINFYDETDAIKYFIGYDSGFLRIYQSAGSASRFYINSDGKTFIPGILEAGTIIKTGGTASQFLKADGSVDANTYITSGSLSNYLLSATAASTYQRLDKMVSNLLASDTEYPNSNAVLAALALKANAANPTFTGDFTISGVTPRLYFVDTDNNPDYTLFTDSGYFYIYNQTAGQTKFSINPDGNTVITGSLLGTSATFSSSITANRIYGNYSSIVDTFTIANPSTSVLLMSSPNDRDAWIYLDQAATASNWGIYHRNIDAAVSGLPGNSIGFIGGGASGLQAYISLLNGNGYFAGNLLLGSTTDNGQRLQVNGTSAFNGTLTVNKDNGYIVLNRTATTNYLGLGYRTANGAKWFVGMRENSTDNYIIYNEATASDVFTIYHGSNLSTFANSVSVLSGLITAPKININSGTTSEFSFAINQQSTFAFGSTNGRRIAYIANGVVDDSGLQFGYDATDKTGIIAGGATSAGAGIDFYTYNGSAWANRARITKDGNFGINTNSPGNYKLYISNGNGGNKVARIDIGYSTGSATFGGLELFRSATNVAGEGSSVIFSALNSSNQDTEYAGVNGLIQSNSAGSENGALAFLTTSAGSTRQEKVRIFGNGNTLIGTTKTDTGYKLDVLGTGRYTGRLTITDSGSAYPIVLNNQNNEQYLSIESASAREAMTRYYNPTALNWYTGIRSSNGISSTSSYHIYSEAYGGDVMALDVAGNAILVGKLLMGYTSLGSSLIQVNGNIRMGTWNTAGSRYIGYTRDDDGTWGVGGASGIEMESVSVVGNYSQNVHLWTHWYNNGSRRALTARYDGNIGIGTTTPSSRLSLGTGVGAKFLVYDNGSSVYSGLGQDVAAGNSTDLFCHGLSNLGFLTFGRLGTDKVSYTEWMRLDVNGRLGLGTISPNAVRMEIRESVSGNPTLGTASGNLMLSQNGLWGTFFGLNGSTGNGWIQQMRADSAVAYSFSINAIGGNVGIGTFSPTNKLHVASGDNEGIFMQGTANGGHWFNFKSANSNLWSMGAQPGLMGWYNRTDSTYKMVIADNGNVSIGTTGNNGYKLQVYGNGYFYNNVMIAPVGESWAEGLAFTMPNTSTWGGLRWRRERAGNDGNWYVGYVGFDSTDDLVFGCNNGGTQINNVIRLTKAGNVSSQGTITATAFYESSDSRLKDLLEDDVQVKNIENLKAKLYIKNGRKEYGYFAQEAQSYMPSAVTRNEDGYLNLSYREVHTVKIDRLEREVEQLKKQLNVA